MLSSEIRAEARRKLAGRWGKAALLVLAYMAIMFVIGFVQGILPKQIEWLISIVVAVIEIPLAYGLIVSFLKFFNEEEVKYFDFLSTGFNNFVRAWKVLLWTLVKMLVPVILLVVAIVLMGVGIAGSTASILFSSNSSAGGFGVLTVVSVILYIVAIIWLIVKSYSYQLSYLIAIENPSILAKEAVERSAELMQGRKAKLFWLQLSFIGWAILAGLTFGIGMLWLLPYIQFATIVFYKDALGNKKVETEPEVIQ